jgi:hypothetical protein
MSKLYQFGEDSFLPYKKPTQSRSMAIQIKPVFRLSSFLEDTVQIRAERVRKTSLELKADAYKSLALPKIATLETEDTIQTHERLSPPSKSTHSNSIRISRDFCAEVQEFGVNEDKFPLVENVVQEFYDSGSESESDISESDSCSESDLSELPNE